MKTSIASLKERLADWHDGDDAAYQLGACLGFWPEFGSPAGYEGMSDCWHGAKGVMWSDNPLGNALYDFLNALVEEGCLEYREEPDIGYRWHPYYEGRADIITVL